MIANWINRHTLFTDNQDESMTYALKMAAPKQRILQLISTISQFTLRTEAAAVC